MTAIAVTLQSFFTDRMARQRQASPHTIASYRDTVRLLLEFLAARTGKPAHRLDFDDLDADAVTAFCDHLARDRGNTARTVNLRLTAIRSLLAYAALRHPEHAASIARVLAIPPRRMDRALVSFLTPGEAEALLAAPDRTRWEHRRDHAWLALTIQTGLRVSELIGLDCANLATGPGAHITCLGKGRKHRAVPLTQPTDAILTVWTAERRGGPADPLFCTRTGRRMTRDAIARRLTLHTATATQDCPTLRGKTITPHVLRHTTAMTLLHAGVDTAVIALWLGHADPRSTNPYLHADLSIKEKALARTTPADSPPGRYQPPDPLLDFLERL